ncbi:hypothetical protein V6N12_067912 [Hibiscus sabdariffa]|uniref:Uncharacterized protein n=1 Tax=Hibiscus sabdariffa TaxID=183260 RepID=A0ABR2FNP9_9ROSI
MGDEKGPESQKRAPENEGDKNEPGMPQGCSWQGHMGAARLVLQRLWGVSGAQLCERLGAGCKGLWGHPLGLGLVG